MKILLIGCSLNPQSRSWILAQQAVKDLHALGIEPKIINLQDIHLPLCDGSGICIEKLDPTLLMDIEQADAILLAVPIYNYDVNAAAKNLVELTGRRWTDKIVGFLCAAGGHGSYMSVMGLANSLMLDFRCLIVPRFVYATGRAFEDDRIVDERVRERIHQLCSEMVRLTAALQAAPASS